MPDIYGLTQEQHTAVGDLLQRSGNIVRAEAPPVVRRGAPSEFVRVMSLDFPTYSPREAREVALFEHDPLAVVVTAKFFGESLAGDVVLKFGSLSIRLDCRSTTAQLRAKLGVALNYCRATVFPGLWEFHFVDPTVVRTQTPPTIDVETYFTGGNLPFTGGVVVTREGWVSATDDGDNFAKVEVIDAVPFRKGQVKAGGIALAQRYGADQFMVSGWSCPEFTFKSM
jgi:hypothetical protein